MLSLKQVMAPNGHMSRLEEMLESMNRSHDDKERPTDSPPALPQRPTSRARLPSSARMRKAVAVAVAATGNHELAISGNQLSNPRHGSNHESVPPTSQSSSRHRDEELSNVDGYAGAKILDTYASDVNNGLKNEALGNNDGIPKSKVLDSGIKISIQYIPNASISEPKELVNAHRTETARGESSPTSEPEQYLDGHIREFNTSSRVEDFGSDSRTDNSGSEDEEIRHPNQMDDSSGDGENLDNSGSFINGSNAHDSRDVTGPGSSLFDNTKSERGAKRWRDAFSGLKKSSRVWCLNSENKWILGLIESTNEEQSVVSFTDTQSESEIQPRFIKLPSSKLLPANPVILEGVDDLIQLSYLNEPAVLHNIRYRYVNEKIYTRAGPVLIAINPFKKVPLYTDALLQQYSNRTKDDLPPHVYMTAESAFRTMVRDGVNQSIIISGESGAGKTETAKIAMQYLAAVGGGDGVENEILQTNPILEAFGNAKTLRNDNSSRFGKLTEIYFDSGKISGAKIQTYLLEKSRVVQQTKGERSYHVFYQLCAGACDTLRECINLRPSKDYRYLNQSDCLTISKVDDAAKFCEMLDAMDVMQISKEEQENVFAMLSAVLWLGNITFSVIDNENHVSVDDDEAVKTATKLLRCRKEDLMDSLSSRKIHVGNEKIVQKLTFSQAADSRDALAKAIYAGLFDWLVDRINKSLEVGKHGTGKSIVILDIYGFESFAKNSFEQLCINYANERLQQYFNRHLFKLEQEEYISEGIDWTRVEFVDNQDCLELIEKRPLGMISLLDEECTFPKGTDYTLAEKLKQHLAINRCFKGERRRGFRVKHYAGEVMYDTEGFLEKNRDLLHADLLQLLSSCEAHLPQLFGSNIEQSLQKLINPLRRNGAEGLKQTVATKFKGQLHRLMQRLENTEPHFVRCIKPNASQKPIVYHDDMVLQQLRCCGVLEVVRISKCGYPTRISHQRFASRYGFLLPLNLSAGQDILSTCVAILHQFRVPPDMYQVGYTKLFFRAGQVGRLEDIRLQTIHGIISFQKIYRGYKARCHFQGLRRSAIFLQSLIRSRKVQRLFKEMLKKHRAAIQIQRHVRCRAQRKVFVGMKEQVILIQSVARGWLARKEVLDLRQKIEKEKQKAVELKHLQDETQKALELKLLKEQRGNPQRNRGVLATKDASHDMSSAQVESVMKATMEVPNIEVDGEEPTVRVPASFLAMLQSRVLMAESALREKEDDNTMLRQRLNHYETKWSEYETKMSSMEDMWKKQMSSLQVSLAAAKKSLASEDVPDVGLKSDDLFALKKGKSGAKRASRHVQALSEEDDDWDWDDNTSVGTKTPEQLSTPYKQPSQYSEFSHAKPDLDTGRLVVNHLVKEFEHRQQVFHDDSSFVVEVKSGQTDAALNPDEELRKLKQRFDAWKKDFKARLRETKAILQKLGNPNPEAAQRARKSWWNVKA